MSRSLALPDFEAWTIEAFDGAIGISVRRTAAGPVDALAMVQLVEGGDLVDLLSEALAGKEAPPAEHREPYERRRAGRRIGGVLSTRLGEASPRDVGRPVVRDFVGYAEMPRRQGLVRFDLITADASLFEDMAEFCLDYLAEIELVREPA